MVKDTLSPGTFKARWLRPLKQWIYRLVEIKSGILLSQSISDQPASASDSGSSPPDTRIGVLHDLYLTVPERASYIWDCATSPEYRGRGYFPVLLDGVLSAHRPTATLALVAVDTHNGASRRALVKASFLPR